jgi:hypothetical protein
MTKRGWNYSGDVNIEHGGYFWREDGASDYVLVVRVTPCSDGGGPDNLFNIEQGAIYLPDDERRDKALSTIDVHRLDASRSDLVEAFLAYSGIDRDFTNSETIVRVGPVDKFPKQDGWNPAPHKILRSNASLRRYVEREFLN